MSRASNRRLRRLPFGAAALLAWTLHAGSALGAGPGETPPETDPVLRWAVHLSASVMLRTTSFGPLFGDFDDADGDAGGRVYRVGGSYVIHEFDLGERHFHPHLETVFSLGIVDEQGGDLFSQVQAAIGFRWRDFPWNDAVLMSAAVGGGLSYSVREFRIDEKRHPGEDRSQFKFFAYLELTFAHPRHPRHEILLFEHHWSGGHVFDEGGIDAWGLGYRYRF